MPRMIQKNYRDTLQKSDTDSEGNHGQLSKRLKKGPWTPTEDAILMEYVKKHGEGNWNSVQKNSGLARCGKSCRLRWANHLRPNLKKGSFTPEEERVIMELHAKLGNKWARMAAQLPGRTDNEIKNYWNTRMKRRQRAGLPIQPHEEVTGYQLQQKQQQQIDSSSTIFSASQLSKLNYNTPIHVVDQLCSVSLADNLQNPTSYNVYSQKHNPFKVFSESINHCGLAEPVFPGSCYSELYSSRVFNQGFASQSIPTQSHDYTSSISNPFSFSAMLMGTGPYETAEMLSAKEIEVPSIQTPSLSVPPAPASSCTNSGEVPLSSSQKNNGLLEDLVLQGQVLPGISSSRSGDHNVSDKGKRVVADGSLKEEDTLIHKDRETRPQSSIEKKHIMDDPLDEIKTMDDDDLLSLLTNFPSCMPLPDWYRIKHD